MREFTREKGFFFVTDIQRSAGIPRTTAQDWVNRLVTEGCVIVRDEKHGRKPARYAAISAMQFGTCRRIFTTVDGDLVEVIHDCISGGCAAFCSHHHARAGGALVRVEQEGTLIRERGILGKPGVDVGLPPLPAVGVAGIERRGGEIVQHIRCIGGPAYSLSDMMARAEGVTGVKSRTYRGIVRGEVRTRALSHITLGIDDTDSRDEGATFALALALLENLRRIPGIIPIGHHIVMLNPAIFQKTAGNSASYIELAAPPDSFGPLVARASAFLADESVSPEWGLAARAGLDPPEGLRDYGIRVRSDVVSRTVAEATAERFSVTLQGGHGVIGALGAVALAGLPDTVLLNPGYPVPELQN